MSRPVRLVPLMLLFMLPLLLLSAGSAGAELFALNDLLTDESGTILLRAPQGLGYRLPEGDRSDDLYLEGDGSKWAICSLSEGRMTEAIYDSVLLTGDGMVCSEGASFRFLTKSGAFDEESFCDMIAVSPGIVLALKGDPSDDISDRLFLLHEDGTIHDTGINVINGLTDPSEERIALCDGQTDLWGYIDPDGEWVIPPVWHYAGPFLNGAAAVAGTQGYGAVGRNGETVLPPEYDLILRTEQAACLIRGEHITVCDASLSPLREFEASGSSVSLSGDLIILSSEDCKTILDLHGRTSLRTGTDVQVSAAGPDSILFRGSSGWLITDRSGNARSEGHGTIRRLSDQLLSATDTDGVSTLFGPDGKMITEGIRGRITVREGGMILALTDTEITAVRPDGMILFSVRKETDD